ncbi:MAG: histidine triad nucleotide-binding protein [Ignavibacteria bacterium]|nr:histidine triad nucleotide-binding protein [Ignavibacteria bacterium]
MENCLFCKIIRKEIPASIIYENEDVIAFNDINPQAPVHILIIPKEHISSPYEINVNNSALSGKLIEAAAAIAKSNDLEGYRLVFNCNEIAGQTVFHIHAHLLGGRVLNWPPG